MIQCTDARHCLCAVGVLSTPDNSVRRKIARIGWTAAAAAEGVVARFILRAQGLPPPTLERLHQEQLQHADIVLLPVPSSEHRLRGRILSLAAWLRVARVVCPPCRWVCKADDDVYLASPSFAAVLRLVSSQLGDSSRVYMGHLAWHTWNTRRFMHHSYFGSYDQRTLHESRRAIDFFGARGSSDAAVAPSLLKALQRCRPGGVLTGCGWCPTLDECDGPFAFAVGWLIVLSAPLAEEMRDSELLRREVQRRLPRVNRTWGPPALEDIWLGSLLHRASCRKGRRERERLARRVRGMGESQRLHLVALPAAYAFNGGWHTARGQEFNTTWLYHNKHELPLIAAHARASHQPPRPLLQCAGDSVDYSGGGATRELLPIVTARARAHSRYAREAGCPGAQRWCSLVEPRLLISNGRYHDARARINTVARPLTTAELATIATYHEEVRAARQTFREELAAVGIVSGEIRKSDYDDM